MANGLHSRDSIFDKALGRLVSSLGLILLVLMLSTQSVYAAQSLNEAVKKAERTSKGKVISARTVERNQKRTHEVRVLSKKGKVKTMRYPANGANKNKAAKKNRNEKDDG